MCYLNVDFYLRAENRKKNVSTIRAFIHPSIWGSLLCVYVYLCYLNLSNYAFDISLLGESLKLPRVNLFKSSCFAFSIFCK